MKLDQLIKLADAATPGPWIQLQDMPYLHATKNPKADLWDAPCIGRFDYSPKDMDYIAAANPATIKRMVELLVMCREALIQCSFALYDDDDIKEALAAIDEFEKEQ